VVHGRRDTRASGGGSRTPAPAPCREQRRCHGHHPERETLLHVLTTPDDLDRFPQLDDRSASDQAGDEAWGVVWPGDNRRGGKLSSIDDVPLSIATDVATDEERLLAAARAGDREAYGRLIAPHQEVAFRAAFLITGSAADAEEATQEAFVKAWLGLERFRLGEPFRPWLVQIAVNEARNRRRGAGRRAGLALRAAAAVSVTTAPSAEERALAAEERARLIAGLERLREQDQLVIAARHLLGLSESETATALGLRPGTVKSRLSRGLARLRAELGEEKP
jgi:RNA polymerase sigma-70 factor (ECF subfamily)